MLRDSVRPTDIPARYGGEEFVVVLPDCTVHDAVAVAERLRARLGRTLENASVPPFTVSVGIARSGPDNGLTETIAGPTRRSSSAKAAGRDRVFVFPATSLEDLPENLDEPPSPWRRRRCVSTPDRRSGSSADNPRYVKPTRYTAIPVPPRRAAGSGQGGEGLRATARSSRSR